MQLRLNEFYNKIIDICHEVLDCSTDELDMTISGGKIYFQSLNSGYSLAVIPDELHENAARAGYHYGINENDFSEYDLFEILETASSRGHDKIYLYKGDSRNE
jgi:hypothetical protein